MSTNGKHSANSNDKKYIKEAYENKKNNVDNEDNEKIIGLDDNRENLKTQKYGIKNSKKSKKKMNKALKVFLIILLILVIFVGVALGSAYYFINSKLSKMQTEQIDTTQVGIDDTVSKQLHGFRNIALLGIDSRADDYSLGNRSDCMIIASINEDTKKIKLISVYRDTYVNVEENGTTKLDKLTHAYSFGGAQNTLKSINGALDLNITEYLTVNFDAVIAAVNALGGVNIELDSSEIKYINDYIDATSASSGIKSSHISNAGTHSLDGVQAVAYSRIRYTAGGDYKRTERMRTVVGAMFSKAKSLNITKLNDVADEILPKIRTNITSNEIMSLIPSMLGYKLDGSLGWPYETKGITLDRWYGVPVTLESNVKKLHKDVFEQEDYTVSDTVKNMSNAIIKKTGYKN